MASSNTIIVGGGVAALSPFTVGAIPKIAATNPPGINDSVLFQRTQSGATVITVNNNDYPTATEALQITDGLISDTGVTGGVKHGNFIGGQSAAAPQVANAKCVVIGTSASSFPSGNASFNNVVIGQGAQIRGNSGSCVLIGDSTTLDTQDPAFGAAVMIGSATTFGTALTGFTGIGISCGGSIQGSGVAIGNGIVIANLSNYVCIGRLSKVKAQRQTVIGDNAVADTGHTASIAIGNNAVTLAANQLVIGATNVEINNVLIGNGDAISTYGGITYRCTNGSGNNDVAGSVVWQAPIGTGNAVGGGFEVQVGVAGAGGAAPQTATRALRIEGGTRNVAWWGSGSFGSGIGVMFLANAGTNPTTNPTAGGILYVNGGALTYRGSGGTVTVIAPA